MLRALCVLTMACAAVAGEGDACQIMIGKALDHCSETQCQTPPCKVSFDECMRQHNNHLSQGCSQHDDFQASAFNARALFLLLFTSHDL